MNLGEYQTIANKTDQYPSNTLGRPTDMISPLGLFGEVGSLASEYKKYLRDKDAYEHFPSRVKDELGDIVWYLSNLATRFSIKLSDVQKEESKNKNFPVEVLKKTVGLSALIFEVSSKNMELAATEKENLQNYLNESTSLISRIAASLGFTFEEVLINNLEKTKNRWGPDEERRRRSSAPIYDEQFGIEERLPRLCEIEFIEKPTKSGTVVLMRMNGVNVGDRLTDNSSEDDGYRYHDMFHWAHVAVLGWSPVVRALLKVKRKSNSKKDEVDDGARAIIAEEAISLQVFNYAKRHSFLEGLNRVDQNLLKLIKDMSRGLEVQDVAEWEWELAILSGYEVFRQLRKSKGGILGINADQRKLTFRPK